MEPLAVFVTQFLWFLAVCRRLPSNRSVGWSVSSPNSKSELVPSDGLALRQIKALRRAFGTFLEAPTQSYFSRRKK